MAEGLTVGPLAVSDIPMRHQVYLVDLAMKPKNGGRSFVMFNDGPLSMEPITAADLTPIEVAPGSPCASAAWSCGVNWYIIRKRWGLALLNVHSNRGVLCRKLSADFIRWFIDDATPAPSEDPNEDGEG